MTDRLKEFFKHDAAGGVLLVIAAAIAMIMANSPFSGAYQSFLDIPVVVQLGAFEIAKPLLLWINDGLMAIFFFLIGLEIKREMMEGQLRSFEEIKLPGIAAIAGIAFPALFYVWLNSGDGVAIKGWAIPSATDIAFALGIFILFGKGLPLSLKLFLLTVAILDDIGAIVIIALFYSAELSTTSLAIAAVGLAILFVLNRYNVHYQSAYFLVGIVVWAAVLKSGVHATLAGFALAWFIPLNVKRKDGHRMLPHIEHELHPWVAFMVLSIFAFANDGVQLVGASMDDLFNPITLGIAGGLFLGKQVGMFGACWIAVTPGLARLPIGATWLQLYRVILLCGVGFTMSLFIGSLAFAQQGVEYQLSVKVGVLMGSILSAVPGSFILTHSKPNEAYCLAGAKA